MRRLVKAIEEAAPTGEVKVWLTERVIDGVRYGEEICAKSMSEAESLAGLIGATVCGERITVACMVCGNEIISELSSEDVTLVN